MGLNWCNNNVDDHIVDVNNGETDNSVLDINTDISDQEKEDLITALQDDVDDLQKINDKAEIAKQKSNKTIGN